MLLGLRSNFNKKLKKANMLQFTTLDIGYVLEVAVKVWTINRELNLFHKAGLATETYGKDLAININKVTMDIAINALSTGASL